MGNNLCPKFVKCKDCLSRTIERITPVIIKVRCKRCFMEQMEFELYKEEVKKILKKWEDRASKEK